MMGIMKMIKYSMIFLCSVILLFSCNSQKSSNDLQKRTTDDNLDTPIGNVVSAVSGHPNIIFQDSKHNYWIGGSEEGVYKFNENNLILYSTKDGLCSDEIIGIQEDTFGNIYFDTHTAVCKFDGKRFTDLPIKENTTKNQWTLEPNDLWFRMGWNRSGPFRYDGQFLYALAFPRIEQADIFYSKYPNVSYNPYGLYSLYKDSKGVIWFGTSSLGVARYDGASLSWMYEEAMTTTPSGGAYGIRSIFEDRAGDFWFTNTRYRYDLLPENIERNGTIYMTYNRKKGADYKAESGEEEFTYFMSMTEDHKGNLWMVTADEGVWRNDGKELINYPITENGESIFLFSIYIDKQDHLWLITRNKGLYKYNEDKFEKYIFRQN